MFKTTLLGRLGEDAREVQTSNGSSFISMRVASNERINKENVTTWVTVNANSERYKNLLPHLKKGSAVFVTGSLRSTIYTAKDGTPGIDHKVSADSIEFANLGGGQGENGANGANGASGDTNASAPSKDAKIAEMSATVKPSKSKAAPAPQVTEQEDGLPF